MTKLCRAPDIDWDAYYARIDELRIDRLIVTGSGDPTWQGVQGEDDAIYFAPEFTPWEGEPYFTLDALELKPMVTFPSLAAARAWVRSCRR